MVKIRNPPKKQSSMQKLMAKMKEIKLRVTGKADAPSSATPSNLSKPSEPATTSAAASAAPANPAATPQALDPEVCYMHERTLSDVTVDACKQRIETSCGYSLDQALVQSAALLPFFSIHVCM